jgi:TRAP-type C4-dicarboxylate transport system permease small subunit
MQRCLAWIFGTIFVTLSVVVTVETLSRKLFNFSIQGADELGGYSLAFGSVIAFSLALVGRNHIRVDVFHGLFSVRVQAALNWLSIVLLAAFGLLMAWLCLGVLRDSATYQSTAQTPWATPLIYPQGLWYFGLVAFAVTGVVYALRATRLLAAGKLDVLNRDFHPKSTKEELKEELDDFAARSGGEGAAR